MQIREDVLNAAVGFYIDTLRERINTRAYRITEYKEASTDEEKEKIIKRFSIEQKDMNEESLSALPLFREVLIEHINFYVKNDKYLNTITIGMYDGIININTITNDIFNRYKKRFYNDESYFNNFKMLITEENIKIIHRKVNPMSSMSYIDDGEPILYYGTETINNEQYKHNKLS